MTTLPTGFIWARTTFVAALAVAAVGCTSSTAAPAARPGSPSAQAQGWTPLGQRDVSFAVDHDTVMVTADRGRFRSLRFQVAGSPLELGRIKVTFGNGQVFQPNVRHVFRKGALTRRIDLPGKQRVIRKIEFWYRSLGPASGRANVRIFGGR